MIVAFPGLFSYFSIYVHAVLTWARTLRPGDVKAACNGCVPMHQISFDWLIGGVYCSAMSHDFHFSGQIGDNECINVLVSDILTFAYEKSTDLGEGFHNDFGWDFYWGESTPSGYSG